jgi:hypothetical protein
VIGDMTRKLDLSERKLRVTKAALESIHLHKHGPVDSATTLVAFVALDCIKEM